MEIWIIAGICAFLIFIAGIVILFFPARRKIGAILTSAGMLLMVGSIIGIIVVFHIISKYKMMCSIILLKEQVKQPLKRRRRIKLTMKIPQIILRKKSLL